MSDVIGGHELSRECPGCWSKLKLDLGSVGGYGENPRLPKVYCPDCDAVWEPTAEDFKEVGATRFGTLGGEY